MGEIDFSRWWSTTMVSRGRHTLAAVMLATTLTGCINNVIEGAVYDIKGDALPGVVVASEGTRFQGLTDALGRYSIRYEPGRQVLHFTKTGYTPGRFVLVAEGGGRVDAAPVRLWCLPPNKGVYLYEAHRYRPAKPIECERFTTAEGAVVLGTDKYRIDWPDAVLTTDPNPVILCYNMPRRDAKVHRLEQSDILLADDRTGTKVTVWLPGEEIPASLLAIDEPERLLQQVQLDSSLSAGTYAVHWGALEGTPDLEPRMFVFTVQPEEVASPEADEQPGDLPA